MTAVSGWRGYDAETDSTIDFRVFMQVVPRLSVEPMRYEDIAAVQAIERQVFASPWPKNAYASELSQNRQASYVVLRQDGDLVGYAGLWRVALEAHVTDNGEDAVIMWSDSIHAPGFKRGFNGILSGLDVAGVGGGPSMEYPSA